VLFNQGRGQIEVRRKDGVILEAEKLSGGAYDQLYLAIRLALGERILQGTKGFFIMDDPFVKADTARLQKQIEVLQRITQLGWQVLYFSAKAEIKDALKTPIKRGTVNYLEIQGIFS
jgi:exonuclease SbcC